jgi:putative phage-type endonuclease
MIDLELRRKLITATDVGPIFGVDAYRDAFDVWAGKHGHAPPFEPTARMLLGKDLEQGIVQAYSRITGRQVQWADRTVRHPVRQWMGASPDALVGDPLERVVDAKLVFYDQRRKWGETSAQTPEGIQLQMWWQMAVCECDVCDVAAWMGEDAPRIYTIERNREAERVVIAKCEEWHRRYVLGDEIPPISGSRAAAVWLQQAFPKHARPDMRDATEEEVAVLEEYTQVRLLRQDAKAQCEKMENQIKLAIGEREGLEWPGGTFTWRRTKDGIEVDWESLGKGLLNEKDKETAATLLGIYTKPKPGQRKIRFVSNAVDVSDAA